MSGHGPRNTMKIKGKTDKREVCFSEDGKLTTTLTVDRCL